MAAADSRPNWPAHDADKGNRTKDFEVPLRWANVSSHVARNVPNSVRTVTTAPPGTPVTLRASGSASATRKPLAGLRRFLTAC